MVNPRHVLRRLREHARAVQRCLKSRREITMQIDHVRGPARPLMTEPVQVMEIRCGTVRSGLEQTLERIGALIQKSMQTRESTVRSIGRVGNDRFVVMQDRHDSPMPQDLEVRRAARWRSGRE